MFTGYLRTIDVQWEINPLLVVAMGITAIGGAWLWLGARRWWGRALWWVLLLSPTILMIPLWLGMDLLINTMAVRTYGGLPIYGYAMPITTAIATLVEAAVVLLFATLGGSTPRHIEKDHWTGLPDSQD